MTEQEFAALTEQERDALFEELVRAMWAYAVAQAASSAGDGGPYCGGRHG